MQEAIIYGNSWGFEMTEIQSKVFIWHGSSDKNVDITLAKRIADEIPVCRSTFMDNEGHFSLAGNYLNNILNEIKIMMDDSIDNL